MSGDALDNSFTPPTALAFLNKEFQNFERDRKKWEDDRLGYLSQISILNGEKAGLERVQKDLLRRIKMLEFALNQEKEKNNSNKSPDPVKKDGDKRISATLSGPLTPRRAEVLPGGGIAIKPVTTATKDATKSSSRSILRRWLAEFGYGKDEEGNDDSTKGDSETLKVQGENDTKNNKTILESKLDPVDFSKHLGGGRPIIDENAEIASNGNESVGITLPTVIPVKENNVTNDNKPPTIPDTTSPKIPTLPQVEDSSKEVINNLMEQMSDDQLNEMFGPDGTKTKGKKKPKKANPGTGTLLMTKKVASTSYTNVKTLVTCRSHLDAVRCVAWHSKEPLFLSASEDFTVKLWCLQAYDSKQNSRGKSASKSSVSKDKEVIPSRTYRGHRGPVFAVAFWEGGDLVLSGGMDGELCLWTMPEDAANANQCVDGEMFQAGCYTGHTDAIWDIQVHPKDGQALTASADGSIKLWKLGSASAYKNTFTIVDEKEGEHDVPTSVAWNPSDSETFLATYVTGQVVMWNREKTEPLKIMKPDAGTDAAELHAYRIVVHPHEPLAITAHEDKKIRFWDLTTGTLSGSIVAHQDAVSDVAIDPAGIYVASVGHDVSLRVWSIDEKKCLQEIPVHSRKNDEGIHTVDYHQSLGWLMSGGADSLIKIFE